MEVTVIVGEAFPSKHKKLVNNHKILVDLVDISYQSQLIQWDGEYQYTVGPKLKACGKSGLEAHKTKT